MDVLVRVLFISEKLSWTLEKAKSRQQKNNEQHSKGRLHNDDHRAARTPHSTLYSSQESAA